MLFKWSSEIVTTSFGVINRTVAVGRTREVGSTTRGFRRNGALAMDGRITKVTVQLAPQGLGMGMGTRTWSTSGETSHYAPPVWRQGGVGFSESPHGE